MDVTIREAEGRDAGGIWALIHELAVYERSGPEHTLTTEQLAHDLEESRFKAFVAEDENNSIQGMALMYPIYSTWKGLSWYLEDIIVTESHRRMGIGGKLFERVILFAKEQNAGRLGWQVLTWNEPAIRFYEKYNATLDKEWITCRLYKEQLEQYGSGNEDI
jgi:GNAT superfamily N-acetyltransferase